MLINVMLIKEKKTYNLRKFIGNMTLSILQSSHSAPERAHTSEQIYNLTWTGTESARRRF